jgi:hypothetical protein
MVTTERVANSHSIIRSSRRAVHVATSAWARSSGGPPVVALVFPEFGMRVDQLNERFNSIISTLSGCSSHIDDTDRDCWPAPAVTNCPAVLSVPAHHGSRLIPRHRRDEWRTFEKCAHSANNMRRNCLYINAFQ